MEDGGEDGRGSGRCSMQHALCSYGAITPTHTYSDGYTPEEGFSDDAAAAWLGSDMASVRCGVGPVELRHQCSGQYGVVVLYHASGSEE